MKSLFALFRSHLALLVLIISMIDGRAQSPFTAIFAGTGQGFYLRSDGTTWVTGSNVYGQFGDGSALGKSVPTPIPLSGLVSVAVGERFTLFLKNDGTVMAGGSNDFGQFGNGTTDASNVALQVMTGVKAIAAGPHHSLFLKLDGSVWACGLNSAGQLGDGSTDARSTPVQVLTGVKAVSAGSGFSLFLKTDGSVWATGTNASGQHGDGTFTDRSSPVQVFSGVASISAGVDHSLFIKTDGTAWAAGSNRFGQLGDGTQENKGSPQQVLAGVAAVSGGGNHSLFLKTDGTVWASGFNQSGQLGDGTQTLRTAPVQVLSSVVGISAAGAFSLFLKRDGTVWATGSNLSSQLGDGSQSDRSTAAQMFFETRMKGISAGGGHSLFLKGNGTVWASGDNQFGQLGDGGTTSTATPIRVLSGVKSVSAGRFHSLFIKDDGSAWSCGANTYGQLGNGKTNSGATPNPVQILTDVKAVSAGESHSLFLKIDGSVWACGYNFFGQLGDGTTENRTTPVQVSLTGVKAVSAGALHSLFLKEDATAWAAGVNNDGQLGTGPNVNFSVSSTPVQVLTGVLTLDAGEFHSVFVKDNSMGQTYATGNNFNGELGDGTTNSVFTPKLVFFGGTDVSAGGSHTMFMRGNSIYGTGSNNGALANGSVDSRLTPGKTVTSGEQAVSAGLYHSLILLQNGKVFSSGRNFTGQLGDGSQEHKSTPVEVTAIWIPEMVVSAPDGQRLGSGEGPISFGNVNRGANQSLKFTIRNSGYQSLIGVTPTFVGGNASDFSVAAAPLSEVSPEGTTTFTVRFTPVGNGARATTLRIASNDPDEGFFDIPFLGNGVGVQEISVFSGSTNINDGASASYASVNRGSDKTLSFTIKNTGTANLTRITASLVGGQAADYTILTPPVAVLAPNATTTVSVKFAPAAAGARVTALRIASNDADENPFDISLSGTGINVPEIAVLQGAVSLVDGSSGVDFGSVDVGAGKTIFLTIRNSGTAPLTGILASLSDGAHYGIATAPAASLAPNATTTIGIRFAPSAVGARPSTLRIASNDADERVFDVALSGRGVGVPEIAILNGNAKLVDGTSSVSFGKVKAGASKVVTLTVKNDGTASLAKIAASISGGQATQFTISSKPAANLAPGRSTTIRITFKPTGSGPRGTTLKIASSDANERIFEIKLSGTAGGASGAPSLLADAIPAQPSGAGARITSQSGTDGARHRVLTVDKAQSLGRVPVVEVSSDLIHWFSGPDHTAILIDDATTLKVRDRTPHSLANKRFIRVRWLGGRWKFQK